RLRAGRLRGGESRQAGRARRRIARRRAVHDRGSQQGAAAGPAPGGKAEDPHSPTAVRGPDPGRHRWQDRRPRNGAGNAQRRDGQMLWRRCDPQAQAARETKGRQETPQAGRQRRDPARSLHGRAEPGLMERIDSLYLHVPFCTWVCKYCDFNAYAVLEGLIPPYVEALSHEIDIAGTELPIGPLETVFIGGGTPSLLTAAQVWRVMERVRAIGLAPGAEVTLEANPSNITGPNVEGWLAAGINRLSIGVQSLQTDAHDQLEQYWAAAARLEAAGFTHYEISNWAQPGYTCRHNLAAWNYQPYLGCGAGAHSMFRLADGSTERRWNVKGPHAYIKQVSGSGHAVDGSEALAPGRARGEAAMIGVRLL